MKPQDIENRIQELRGRFAELEQAIAAPDAYADVPAFRRMNQEHRKLERLFEHFDSWVKALRGIEENHALSASENDPAMRELLSEDTAELEKKAMQWEESIRLSLLPPDPNDGKNIILEVKPAAGGDEAALFAGELARAYQHYAETRGWKIEVLDQTPSDLGGVRSMTFSVSGEEVYSSLKYESGVHRVQRVPETENAGRIHTSTVTVSVMPEAEELELNIRPEDLRFDVFRSSGPGGQCVNTTDSAVRVTHIPSGLSVASQQEKSQHKNKAIALRILYARLLERQQSREAAKHAADKRSQVGTGDRSERIRTYNFPQNRVTDHRFNINCYDLPKVMEGDFDLILKPILVCSCEQQLAAQNSAAR